MKRHIQCIISGVAMVALWGLPIFDGVAAANAPVTNPGAVRFALDLNTVKKGYTAYSAQQHLSVSIPKGALTSPTTVFLHEPDSERGYTTPPGTRLVGGVYRYDLQNTKTEQLRDAITVTLRQAESLEHARIWFYDRNQSAWRIMSSHVTEDGALTTRTRLSFAEIAAFVDDEMSAPVVDDLQVKDERFSARAILIADANDNVLYAKNPYQALPMASVTKLMTALVFLDRNPGWGKMVTISGKDDAQPAKLSLQAGDKVSVKDLFNATLVGSKNNAAKALARSTGLTEGQFVDKMNQRARELGMLDTRFVDVTGLKADNQSSVQDVILLGWEAFRQADIAKAVKQKTYTVSVERGKKKLSQQVKTTNQALGATDIAGGKTGFITEAGYNVVLYGKQQNREVIAVVFGAPDTDERFDIAQTLIDLALHPRRPLATID